MEESITLTIDDQSITVPAGTTILDAATQLGIEIPVICYHPHLTANGLCRGCSVDAGGRVQLAACVTPCANGMTIETHNEKVARGRRTLLEMLASTVNLAEAPEIQLLITKPIPAASRAHAECLPSTTTTPSTCAITTSASTAGAACRSARRTPNSPTR